MTDPLVLSLLGLSEPFTPEQFLSAFLQKYPDDEVVLSPCIAPDEELCSRCDRPFSLHLDLDNPHPRGRPPKATKAMKWGDGPSQGMWVDHTDCLTTDSTTQATQPRSDPFAHLTPEDLKASYARCVEMLNPRFPTHSPR